MTTTGSPRRQDLDLMRAAVVGGLIFFHTARIFDPLDFYVKDQPPNLALTLFVLFAGLWGMPLLFVVSGLGAWYSLRSRTATGFIRERLARLLIPFLVGLLLVVPPTGLLPAALRTPRSRLLLAVLPGLLPAPARPQVSLVRPPRRPTGPVRTSPPVVPVLPAGLLPPAAPAPAVPARWWAAAAGAAGLLLRPPLGDLPARPAGGRH